MKNDRFKRSLLETRPQTALRVLPRNQLNSAAVDFLETPADFITPRILGVCVHLGIKTVEQ